MTLKVTQGHRQCWKYVILCILVICSNNVSTVYRFRDITTFTELVTACHLEEVLQFR